MSDTKELTVPEYEDSIEGATLLVWHKHAGDPVSEGEVVAELMTDKVNLEVTSPYAGRIGALNVNEGDTVGVGQCIAHIEAE